MHIQKKPKEKFWFFCCFISVLLVSHFCICWCRFAFLFFQHRITTFVKLKKKTNTIWIDFYFHSIINNNCIYCWCSWRVFFAGSFSRQKKHILMYNTIMHAWNSVLLMADVSTFFMIFGPHHSSRWFFEKSDFIMHIF